MLRRNLLWTTGVFGFPLFRLLAIAVTAAMLSTQARGDIMGFGDFSSFTVNQDDSGNAPTVSNGTIHLTNGDYEYRSVFCNTPQNISQFTASFTYQTSGPTNDGACFVLQNNPAGASAVTTGAFAYGGMAGKSLAVTLGAYSDTSGYFTNGSIGYGALPTSPVALGSGDPINVTLAYNGSTLQESLVDTKTLASYSTTYLILTKFPTVLGGSSAYVGVTADTYSSPHTDQYISNFQFSTAPVPEPSTFALLGVGVIGLLGYVWRKRAA